MLLVWKAVLSHNIRHASREMGYGRTQREGDFHGGPRRHTGGETRSSGWSAHRLCPLGPLFQLHQGHLRGGTGGGRITARRDSEKKTNEDSTSLAYRSKAVVIFSAKSNCFSDTAATSFCIAVPSTQTPRSSKGTVAMETKAIANR